MRKVLFLILAMVLSVSALAQQKIQLRSADKAECVSSDMTSLRASFSFSSIEATDYASDRGTFSWLSLPNTVRGGNEGDPQIPVINQLIAVPVGAQPWIEITSYSATDYNLADYGMKTLVPRQPSLRKDKRPEDVPFVMNEAAYQSTRSFKGEPTAVVSVEGTMRGVQLGKMTIEPVSYDPVGNKIRVFNDIEVTVHFDGADAKATEDLLLETYSPYFDIVYKSLFNGRAVLDAYTEHPDLYSTPVKMLVVTTSKYANCTAFNNWLTWKKQKGIEVDVQLVTSSTSSADVRSLIQSRYNANHPTFLVIVGDMEDVTNYTTWSKTNLNYNPYVSDLQYASIDNDVYHDLYMSRMSVSNQTELGYLVNKILTYEKYTMANPSYLNETLLVAGWDETWTPKVGKPTIQYANNNYFNSAHGITPHVFLTTATGQTGCYDYINQVGFLNYTAHGDVTMLADPQFTSAQVNSMTNNDKYLWIVANCCLTANWGRNCFGEAMIRANNKGAFGYIGSVPESYWYEDYYFGVGAFRYQDGGAVQTVSGTTKGMYDAMFDETGFNCLNSMPYIGNVAVTYAHAKGYQSSVNDEYYWRAYQCLGDGSVMPYLKVPAANNVSHANTLPVGNTSFTVSADAGSYVSISVNDEIIGVATVDSGGTVNVPIAAQYAPGTAMIVVTRNQRQPYINTIEITGGTLYDITSIPSEHGTIIVPEQGYAHSIVTLSATPDEGYCFSSWTVTDANNNSITVTDNQFTMPETSVTVTATFIPGMQVTLASVMNGSISADPMYALQGTTINLKAKPATDYAFNSWVVYETGNVNNRVNVSNNSFTMPAFPVTVSAIFTSSQSGDVTIGSGSSENQNLPTAINNKYSISQQIYTASEVGDAGKITAIAFKVSNSNTATRSLDIYLSHTTKSTFSGTSDWVTQTTTNRVFSGSVTFAASGWTTITLDTPFEYNGTSNLLLTVDDNSNTATSNDYPLFYVYSAGTNQYRAIYKSNKNTNYNPTSTSNIGNAGGRVTNLNQVIFTKTIVSSETLSVAAEDPTGFICEVSEGPSQVQTITIVGCANENITVTASSDFEVSSSPNGPFSNTVTIPVTSKGNRDALNWSFEGDFEGWTTIDADGDGHNWSISSVLMAGSGINSHHGVDMLTSESYDNTNKKALTPDNWLISPQVTLGGVFTMYAMAQDGSWAAEHFGIFVSTTSNTNTSSFTQLGEWTLTAKGSGGKGGVSRSGNRASGNWYKFTVDLSAYAGQTGYIAVRHFNCTDQFYLNVDDFCLDIDYEPEIIIDPNPVDLVTASVYVRMKDGLSVGTHTGTVTVSVNNVSNSINLSGRTIKTFTLHIDAWGDGNGWYLIASPVNENVEVQDVVDMTSNEYDLYYFDQKQEKEWVNYKPHEGNFNPGFSLEAGKGYLYANQESVALTFIGMPYSGDGEVTLTNVEGHRLSGWNLIGNPWNTTATIGKDFLRMNDDHDEIIPAENPNIAPMEGIFVHTDNDGETVTFSTDGAKANFTNERIILSLSHNGGKVIDRAIVRFGEGSTLPKLQIRDNSTKLYFTQGNRDYAVVRVNKQDEMPVNFKASENGNHTITVNVDNVKLDYLHLIDNLTGNDIDLLTTPSYSFNAKTSDYASRFKLVFEVEGENLDSDFAFVSNGQIIINGQGTVQVIDVLGRIITNVETSYYGVSIKDMVPGMYILRLINGSDVKTQKIVIE